MEFGFSTVPADGTHRMLRPEQLSEFMEKLKGVQSTLEERRLEKVRHELGMRVLPRS